MYRYGITNPTYRICISIFYTMSLSCNYCEYHIFYVYSYLFSDEFTEWIDFNDIFCYVFEIWKTKNKITIFIRSLYTHVGVHFFWLPTIEDNHTF